MPLSRVRSGYQWDARAGRYRRRDGRFIPRLTVRRALDRALLAADREISAVSSRLVAGTVTISEWQTAVAAATRDAHLYSAALAKGGWAQMTQSDYGRVGAMLRERNKFLVRFAQEIEAGGLSLPQIRARAEMYTESGRTIYHLTERIEMRDHYDMTEERSVLGPADHCAGCLAEREKGWVAIGSIQPIGTRTCLSRCKCHIEYR